MPHNCLRLVGLANQSWVEFCLDQGESHPVIHMSQIGNSVLAKEHLES